MKRKTQNSILVAVLFWFFWLTVKATIVDNFKSVNYSVDWSWQPDVWWLRNWLGLSVRTLLNEAFDLVAVGTFHKLDAVFIQKLSKAADQVRVLHRLVRVGSFESWNQSKQSVKLETKRESTHTSSYARICWRLLRCVFPKAVRPLSFPEAFSARLKSRFSPESESSCGGNFPRTLADVEGRILWPSSSFGRSRLDDCWIFEEFCSKMRC